MIYSLFNIVKINLVTYRKVEKFPLIICYLYYIFN